jgi:hypothetical protein
LNEIDYSDSHRDVYMSSSNVYTIAHVRNDSAIGDCDTVPCMFGHTLVWDKDDSCNYSFVCSRLRDDPCTLFGLALDVREQIENVCYEGETHTGFLGPQDDIYLNIWFHPEAEYEIKCHLWCTQDGELPESNSGQDQGEFQELISSLVGLLSTSAFGSGN